MNYAESIMKHYIATANGFGEEWLMMVQTKRIENPIYVITHTYFDEVKERVVGIYDSEIEANITVENLVEETILKLKEATNYEIKKVVFEGNGCSIVGKFRETEIEMHSFKISEYDKNHLYLCNCVGLS